MQSPSAVSQGQSSFTIVAEFGDCTVGLERGKSKSVYVLDGSEYPKAGVKVPVAVDNKIRMPVIQATEPFVADQFDRPFLLDRTGSEAAKVLGDLTNATLLLESSREANTRRQRYSQVAKLRAQDVAAISARVQEFSGLPDEKKRLADCRQIMDKLRDLSGAAMRLEQLVKSYESSQRIIEMAQSNVLKSPQVQPELLQVETYLNEFNTLEVLISKIVEAGQRLRTSQQAVEEAQNSLHDVRHRERQLLRDMGQCPLCGQETISL